MTAVVARPAPAEVSDAWDYRRLLQWVPLALVLIAQLALSVRLIPSQVAGMDEARYITAGHQLIYELWNGGGSPYYEDYFSGAPDIYSPLAAIADHLGGIVEVRLMSLAFMLTATSLLFATTRRLFGHWAGVAAAALFASVGLTHSVGVYSNYDALAMMFMASATYCAVRSRNSAKWLLLVPVGLLAANASKYTTVLFDPVIIGVAALICPSEWKDTGRRVASLSVATICILLLGAYLAGGAYIHGIIGSTFARRTGALAVVIGAQYPTPARDILRESWTWVGPVLATGALAVLACLISRQGLRRAALLALLVVAGLLVTIEALHLGSDHSMRQHDDFGIWFTCIAGGYVLGYLTGLLRSAPLRVVASAGAAVLVLASGYQSARTDRLTSAGSTAKGMEYFAQVGPFLAETRGRILAGGFTNFQMLYINHLSVPWFRLFDDVYIKYPIPGRGGDSHGRARGAVCFKVRPGCMYLEGPNAYRAAVRAHWFDFITLYGNHGTNFPSDAAITQAAEHTPGYILLTDGPPTWIYAPSYRQAP